MTAFQGRHTRRRTVHDLDDLLDTPARSDRGPSDYGLTPAELHAEGHRLLTVHGWAPWEIAAVVADPGDVPAPHGWTGR